MPNDKFVLAVNGEMLQLQKYLGFGAKMVAVQKVGEGPKVAAVVQIPAEHAEWQGGRLASGLYGGQIFYTRAECYTAMMEAAQRRAVTA
jgi:hypothetical protein